MISSKYFLNPMVFNTFIDLLLCANDSAKYYDRCRETMINALVLME